MKQFLPLAANGKLLRICPFFCILKQQSCLQAAYVLRKFHHIYNPLQRLVGFPCPTPVHTATGDATGFKQESDTPFFKIKIAPDESDPTNGRNRTEAIVES
ncbi:Uncharacterized protein TCM_011777 [Theobroma cacao]|uniref:Uncharacterized protein n=1 Tax=Theobroma cacao TaxID=3641 RepID=A0A061EC83_THECC|nr:Uncharacterized protein TCM_011777 [Theobroma cacao]